MYIGGVLYPNFSQIMHWMFHYIWILPFCMGTIITVVETDQSSQSHFTWEKSNTMFGMSKYGAKLTVPLGYNLNIICPYQTGEFYKIYWVPEKDFKLCVINKDFKNVSLLVNCNKPNSSRNFSFEIKQFTGVPYAKDFKLGSSYYIATMSTGTYNGIGNTYQGMCNETNGNMRLNLTISSKDTSNTSTSGPTGNTTKHQTKPTQPTHVSKTTTKPTTTKASTTPSTTATTKRTPKPTSPVIPEQTDIIINVPDNGNTGIIDASGARSLTSTWAILLLSLCLSISHLLKIASKNHIHR